ncbi:hypothetical protein FY034_07355 [Trichlorobacter lovleyi]|uniref:CHC2 zinc finger domain-containing protein n=1 Tax=Trichlorobacter lovleyi TaxID=313985 RepID=UPI00223E98BB|nr:CHC2 zinc finger domain-containing protein [Trichlorobacter lovleyi]QOX78753.1 hypothetical protein FY034_07355 [Trichlorobacter lovleyi]
MILALAEKHISLTKTGSNYVGACPICGGGKNKDAFTVNVAKDFVNCYSCGFNADPVRFLRQIEGKTCPEAHRELGITCERVECPVWDKCSRGRGERTDQPAAPDPAQQRPTGPVIHQADTPAEKWQQKAAALVEHAHQQLLTSSLQLDYLAGRGLPREAVEKYRLGYLPEDYYRQRSAWGLPEEISEKTNKPKKLWLPQGIVIPWADPAGSGAIHRIRIRKQNLRDAKDPRYHWLPGSGNDIICLNPTAKAHVIVESDLDGLLIDWLAGDLVATVPLGSCSTRPKATAFESLQQSRRILVALDFDKPQWNEQKQRMVAPGAEACGWWSKTFPDTWKRWPVPDGKDPGEAFQAGIDLHQWVRDGLPPALRVEIKAPVVTTREETVTKTVAPDAGNDHSASLYSASAQGEVQEQQQASVAVVKIGTHQLHITDDKPTWEKLGKQGKTAYSINELQRMLDTVGTAGEYADHAKELLLCIKDEFSDGGYIEKTVKLGK